MRSPSGKGWGQGGKSSFKNKNKKKKVKLDIPKYKNIPPKIRLPGKDSYEIDIVIKKKHRK